MGDTIEVSKDAFEPITELVKLGLFKDEKEALKIWSWSKPRRRFVVSIPRSWR